MTTIASPFLLLLGLFCHDGDLPAAPGRPTGGAASAPEAGEGGARTAAREALADGNRRLKAGDVPAAIEAYHHAQALYPPAAAKIEFNIAKAEEARGDTPAAAAAFERFLAQALDLSEEFRKEAREQLARLSAGLGTLQVDQQRAGLSIVIDGEARAQTPLEHGLWVRPGRHVLTLEQGDHVLFRDSVEVVAGATARVNAALPDAETAKLPASTLALAAPAPTPPPLVMAPSEPPSPAAPVEPSDRPIWKRWWFWTGIAAVAAAGTATVLILRARDDCSGDGTTVCRPAMF